MGDRVSTVASLQPIGALLDRQWPIRRRTFVQAGALVPGSALLLPAGESRAADALPGARLRFVRDKLGVLVIDQPDDGRPTNTWRLLRHAFGAKAAFPFRLRTLTDGPDAGYELELFGARFGTLPAFRHIFVFLRGEHQWRVRLRTFMFGDELPSTEVLLRDLSDWQAGRALDSTVRQGFVVRAGAKHLALMQDHLFEGYLRVHGPLDLLLDVQAVWHLLPAKGGSLKVRPGDYSLPSAKFAWCAPAPRGKGGESTDPGEPVFCAHSRALERGSSIVFSAGQRPEVQLVSIGEVEWSYTRSDWKETTEHPPGSSNLKAAWCLTLNRVGPGRFGPLDVENGILQTTRDRRGTTLHRFDGAIGREEQSLDSRIGRLKVRGWTSTDGASVELELHPASKKGPLVEVVGSGSGQLTLGSIRAPILLLRADVAVQGCEFSQLEFKPSLLTALFQRDNLQAQEVLAAAGSYLWLGEKNPPAGLPLASIDLTRARLEVSRTGDLAHIAFMFSGLHLQLHGAKAWITDLRPACSVVLREVPGGRSTRDAILVDQRAILIAEFPSQHVLEETLFRPGAPDWPDVQLAESQFEYVSPGGAILILPTALEPFLRSIENAEVPDRLRMRRAYAERKIDAEAKRREADKPFITFSRAFKIAFERLPAERRHVVEDQGVYIGPLGMDPDVAAVARRANDGLRKAKVDRLLRDMLDRANNFAKALVVPAPQASSVASTALDDIVERFKRWMNEYIGSNAPSEEVIAQLRENAIAGAMQEYGFFKDFYRQKMTTLRFSPAEARSTNGAPKLDIAAIPKDSRTLDIEYFSPANRLTTWTRTDLDAMTARAEYVVACYALEAVDDVALPSIMRARFARPSRLAFRVRCDQKPRHGKGARNTGTAAAEIPFSFNGLTNWSGFEGAVAPRAMKLPTFDDAGHVILDVGAFQPASGADQGRMGREDVAMLEILRMRSGRFISAQERLADIEASLKEPPGPLETSIELPARLLLSPSQNAIWRTPRAELDWPTDPRRPRPLWSADLVTRDPDPLLRAVHSPDLRAGFVRSGLESARLVGEALRTPIPKAPPRGPRAPWTLGIEESGQNSTDLVKLHRATRPKEPLSTEQEICGQSRAPQGHAAQVIGAAASTPASASSASAASAAAAPVSGVALHPLVDYLCQRRDAMGGYGRAAIFRSTLDAYDRHELVLLSSAFGLPVRGRRERNGQLQEVKASSQVDVPADWRPIDIEAGSALYRPRALQVNELRLSTLGGTLRHDTGFVPPSSARHLAYGPLFDSLSIERWQHWTVLGRDVFAEVVYKGFLFPIGHRASLVKQTERVFLRHQSGGRVRAFLRQRMFIRIGQPDKTFPAVGQPNGGRQFPASLVHMLTLTTPDIVDPAEDTKKSDGEAAPGGRLYADEAGLVFWPRTARVSGAEVQFEFQVEQGVTRASLIFVDNTAANRPELMDRLVKSYNAIESPDQPGNPEARLVPLVSAQHVRTLDFGGQTLRYCDEIKPGASSHKTLTWTLKATGCAALAPAKEKALGPGEWEGQNTLFDDPSLEGADQPPFYPALETARIRIDQVERMSGSGQQVALVQFDGYYIANGFEATDANQSADPLQIYLDVVNRIRFSMGSSGDRSGGIFRPDSLIVALCRQRGPLGGNELLPAGKLHTVTPNYTVPAGRTANAAAVPAYRNSFPSNGSLPSTKILGLVSISDLLKYLDVGEGFSGLPVLREVVEYAGAGVGSSAQVVRVQVIVPLRGIIGAALIEWTKAGSGLSGRTSGLLTSLGDVFPDVHQALHDFDAALGTADSDNSAVVVASLAEVYECGRRLVDACSRAVSNPLDRIQEALVGKLGELLNVLAGVPAGLLGELKSLSDVPDLFADVVAASPDEIARLLGYRFPWLRGDSKEIVEATGLMQLSPSAVRQAVQAGVTSALKPSTPLQEVVRRVMLEILNAADVQLGLAFQHLRGGELSEMNTEAAVVVGEARQVLDKVRAALRNDSTSTYRLPPGLEDMSATLESLLGAARALQSALVTPSPTRVAGLSGAVIDVVKLVVGPAASASLGLQQAADQFVQAELALAQTTDRLADVSRPAPTCPTLDPEKFSLPKWWRSPAAGHRVLIALDEVAKAAQDALKDTLKDAAKDPPPPGRQELRRVVGTIGNVALRGACLIHDSAWKLAQAAAAYPRQFNAVRRQAADLMLVPLMLEERRQVVASVETAATSLREEVRAIMNRAAEVPKPVVGAIRRLLVAVLDWLLALLGTMEPWAQTWTSMDPDGARPVMALMTANRQAIAAAKAFDAGTVSDIDWMADLDKAWPKFINLPGVVATTIDAAIASLDEAFARQIRAWWKSAQSVESEGVARLSQRLVPLFELFSKTYQELSDKRDVAWNALKEPALVPFRGVLLVAPDLRRVYPPPSKEVQVVAATSPLDDQLFLDRSSLRALIETSQGGSALLATADRQAYVREFLRGWVSGSATPLRIVQQARRLSIDRLRSMLLGLIDFGAIREEVEDRIKRLIPSSASLSYDFSTSFSDTAEKATAGVFRPSAGCALTVHSTARVDLLGGAPATFVSVGEIGAFDIRLIGEMDALTLHFKGLHFESNGGPFKCDLRYAGVTIGPLLKFLEQLQPFFGGKSGGGFYLIPLSTGLGLEAGYRLNLGTISLGTVSFFNISLNASTRLPFDDRSATFVASMSRRDAPFTISVAPYGGSGFFALEADAQGIVGFEASFEYGGAAAFHYGPLQGHGRLMTGIYIRSTRTSTDLSATFYVGGSASIWIFSFGASLYVTARPDGCTSKMVGEATYTFSFSIGLADYDYRVKVKVELDWANSGPASCAKRAGLSHDSQGARLASVGRTPDDPNAASLHFIADRSAAKANPTKKAETIEPANRVVDTVCQMQDWGRYLAYFDLERPLVEEFQ